MLRCLSSRVSITPFPSSLVSSTTTTTILRRIYNPTTTLHTTPGRRRYSTLPNLPLFHALKDHDPARVAVVHSASARAFTYGNLVADVLGAKGRLLQVQNGGQGYGGGDSAGITGERVAFLVENSYDYVVTLLAILATDAIAVPLSPAFPTGELQYILDNSGAKVLLASKKYAAKAREVLDAGLEIEPVLDIKEKITVGGRVSEGVELEGLSQSRGGMMLYTSGTTSRPKGVLIPQSALTAQASSLVEAWKYRPQDRLLHLLPLHHIHGTVNAIVTPVLAGSSIEFMYPFNPDAVWNHLAAPFLPSTGNEGKDKITFLTAVPTIYNRLLTTFPSLPEDIQPAACQAISPDNLRLNISGSAALPTPTKQAWQDISNGNVLLERYGMTEVGMAISCGLDFNDRVDGSVGWPLPSVEARLVDTDTNEVIHEGEEVNPITGREREGEIQLRGPCVFREYWGNKHATREAFVNDDDGNGKWFKTGDVATRRPVSTAGNGSSGDWAKGPMYFIQGRRSVDIIKTGGEKVSALEVERELLSLPQVNEAAVLALPSPKWGQKVAVIVVLHPPMANTGKGNKQWSVMDMRRALKDKLAPYKIPVEMRVLDGIPRNAMGKVNKKMLVREVFGE